MGIVFIFIPPTVDTGPCSEWVFSKCLFVPFTWIHITSKYWIRNSAPSVQNNSPCAFHTTPAPVLQPPAEFYSSRISINSLFSRDMQFMAQPCMAANKFFLNFVFNFENHEVICCVKKTTWKTHLTVHIMKWPWGCDTSQPEHKNPEFTLQQHPEIVSPLPLWFFERASQVLFPSDAMTQYLELWVALNSEDTISTHFCPGSLV